VITIVALVIALLFLPYPWNLVVPIVAAVVDVVETGLFLWWSKRRRAAVGVEALVGRRAVAVARLAPRGQVKLDGELWEARADRPVEPGGDVVVTAVEGLLLDVTPAEPGA
jgi:membrane-bound serine protease (ClpP class)